MSENFFSIYIIGIESKRRIAEYVRNIESAITYDDILLFCMRHRVAYANIFLKRGTQL